MVINSVQRQHVQHKRNHIRNKPRNKIKKKKSDSKTNILLECQTQKEVSDNKLLQLFGVLPLHSYYKTQELLSTPYWVQQMECVFLNAIDIPHMPFMSSSDVLLQNLDDNNPLLDCTTDMDTVQVIYINTSKFTSGQLAEYAELPCSTYWCWFSNQVLGVRILLSSLYFKYIWSCLGYYFSSCPSYRKEG